MVVAVIVVFRRNGEMLLRRMQAQQQQVQSRRRIGITIVANRLQHSAPNNKIKEEVTTVAMKRLSNPEVNAYLASGDWKGKAGGYAIQGPAGAFIPWINGSYTGIVGLPLTETANLLTAAGLVLYGEMQ